MDNGWIKLHRSVLEWEWHDDPNMIALWVYLLLHANHEAKRWHGIVIERGQLVSGRKSLSEATGISEQKIRTCLARLEQINQINQQSTNKYTIITICNYDKYQCVDDPQQPTTNQQTTNNQPTTNQQTTTNKNIRNKEIKNNISSSSAYACDIKKEEIDIDFYAVADYWNQHTKGIYHEIVGLDMDSNIERWERTRRIITRYGKKLFAQAIVKVVESEFLRTKYWMNYDWLIQDYNFDKVVNGHYDNKPKQNETTRRTQTAVGVVGEAIHNVCQQSDGCESDI